MKNSYGSVSFQLLSNRSLINVSLKLKEMLTHMTEKMKEIALDGT